MKSNKVKFPPFRWLGGKWRLAPWIISFFPPHRVYTEVFGGGASVLLRKERSYAEVYNDLDGEIVNFFRVMQDPNGVRELSRLLEMTPFARAELELFYDRPKPVDPIERARRLLVAGGMGFGSSGASSDKRTGFRSTTFRSRTVPAHDWTRHSRGILAVADRFKGVVIENRPAIQVLLAQDGEKVLHYVDPPYVHSCRRSSSSHQYRHEMTDEDHRKLALVLLKLKGMVLLSGYDNPIYRELYRGWHSETKIALDHRAKARTEVIWANPALMRMKSLEILMEGIK